MGLVAMIMNIVVILLVLIGLSFIFGPGLQLNPESFKMKEKPEFLGTLSPNKVLDSAERLFEGRIGGGPESIVVKDNILYTGVANGEIQRIEGQKFETLVRIGGKDCEVHGSGPDGCGRPLGMRLNNKGDELVVADPQKGLYTVSLETGKVTTLVSSSTRIDGKPLGFIDDLAITSNGDIYFSDATSKWGPAKFHLEAAENAGNGRILHYNAENKTVTSLVSNIHFANGVELPPEEDYVIFAETMRANLLKYYLRGTKKGQVEFFRENLPGFPDNIRRSPRGTYWVALAAVRLPYEDSVNEQLSEYPFVRRILHSTIDFLMEMFQIVKSKFPNPLLDIIHQQMFQWLITLYMENTEYGLIIELNSHGEILRSLHSPNGVVNKISQVTEDGNTLYIASYQNNFIGKLSFDPNISGTIGITL